MNNVNNYKNISAIILAGGKGTRFQKQKQFCNLAGKQVWEYSYQKICDIIGVENVVVVGVDIEGGRTRTESVINGINAISKDTKRVIIIEAARPLVTKEQLEILINDTHDSTTFVRPLVNTVVYRDGRYLDREKLYELLTPQAFNYNLLKAALNSGKFQDVTDETRIMYQYHGILPYFIETTGNLFKITYPDDIFIANVMLEKL